MRLCSGLCLCGGIVLARGCAGALRNRNKCPREVAFLHDVILLYQLTSYDILRLQDIGRSYVTSDDLEHRGRKCQITGNTESCICLREFPL